MRWPPELKGLFTLHAKARGKPGPVCVRTGLTVAAAESPPGASHGLRRQRLRRRKFQKQRLVARDMIEYGQLKASFAKEPPHISRVESGQGQETPYPFVVAAQKGEGAQSEFGSLGSFGARRADFMQFTADFH
jgi:hypothetical protein